MIKILIVDDSAVVRKVLTKELSKYSDLEVIGSAGDPYIARDKIEADAPDVIILDIEMPRLDGLSFLAKIMKYNPIPVIIVSSLTANSDELRRKALKLGAFDVISKPGTQFSVPEVSERLVGSIRAAVKSKPAPKASSDDEIEDCPAQKADLETLQTTHKVIAIGASTGGTQAIEKLLTKMPTDIPGMVIVLHMPEGFTRSFAERINGISKISVREAKNDDIIVPGVALIAPGNMHLLLHRSGAQYTARVKDGPLVHHQKPSVDVLFQSVARCAGKNAIGVILTGMGADGAKGLLEMRNYGAYTIAQDEKSCVVFGMPHEAIKLGAAIDIAPLDAINNLIINHLVK